MKPDPDLEAYEANWAENYQSLNYGRSLSARVLSSTHKLLEKDFGPDIEFPHVLEVGAGDGAHINSVRHKFSRYTMTDRSTHFLKQLNMFDHKDNAIEIRQEDATHLSFPDDSVDRLIATHVLEHLPEPHNVLREWVRVIRPGGVLSLILPCDPGMFWRFGRLLGPRRNAHNAGIEYDYWMAREHINSIYNLRALLEYYFPKRSETWWPLRVPAPDANLIYAANIVIDRKSQP